MNKHQILVSAWLDSITVVFFTLWILFTTLQFKLFISKSFYCYDLELTFHLLRGFLWD